LRYPQPKGSYERKVGKFQKKVCRRKESAIRKKPSGQIEISTKHLPFMGKRKTFVYIKEKGKTGGEGRRVGKQKKAKGRRDLEPVRN